ncbi:S8 family serine peptidase [Pseudidiomarina donghaiensis]|uniref:Peptidase S8 n=1 Tax=Pseudidiomarina donghaiensis TaxID=519452 RepID=A0A432XAS8_9GAMM|nr:S8 family serine peptidase [Pseudidiomarina donghaiensis]RUO45858.1 peptidase S8 [Pseudidiomarina donghaiensis]SFV25137.1 Peptidase inhibitor I9 [Pseudidiomarina donghaiensis]
MSKATKVGALTLAALSLAVSTAIHAHGKAGDALERVIVEFKPGSKHLIEAALHEDADGHWDGKDDNKDGDKDKDKIKQQFKRFNAMAIEVPHSAIHGLMNNPNVISVTPDEKREILSTQWEPGKPYGIEMVQADLVSDSAAGTRTVCIIDSGYDMGHPDLQTSGVTGVNDAGTGTWYTDENGHGTHVAGTIAALSNGEGVVGVMPNGQVNLHIVKVFSASGWAYSSSLMAAAEQCADYGANVINMSLGGSRANRTEERAFAQLNAAGILSIAAAGNDGNTRHSYPASYDAVVSVAAVDASEQHAAFSQQTDQVELAGPGVSVLSSVPRGTGEKVELTVAGTAFEALAMEGTARTQATGALANCGLGDSTCQDAAGKVCLIERGVVSFAEKVQACEAGGGVGTVVYNNEPGVLLGTMGDYVASIPAVGVSDTDGAALLGQIGNNTTVGVTDSDWAYFDGTSMATPHVAGVAALVWSHHTTCSNDDIRNALAATAKDLGAAGRDTMYGHGLVQAKDAVDYLTTNGCGGSTGGDTGGGDTGGDDGGSKGPGNGKGNGKK